MGIYVEKEIVEPYKQDDEQDMWVGTISYITSEPSDIPHEEVIEVRANDEVLLRERMSKVLSALNFSKNTRGL